MTGRSRRKDASPDLHCRFLRLMAGARVAIPNLESSPVPDLSSGRRVAAGFPQPIPSIGGRRSIFHRNGGAFSAQPFRLCLNFPKSKPRSAALPVILMANESRGSA